MRVLVTGMTNSHCGVGNYWARNYTLVDAMKSALADSGHQVECRRVRPTERLDEYDFVWWGFHSLESFSSRNMVPALAVYKRILAEGRPHVAFVDDWRLADMSHSVNTVTRSRLSFAKRYRAMQSHTHRSYWKKHFDELWQFLHQVKKSGMGPVAAPMFPWGDDQLFLDRFPLASRVIRLDYTPYVDVPVAAPYDQSGWLGGAKQECWVYAALYSHDAWLLKTMKRLSWPVLRIGPRKRLQGGRGRSPGIKGTERDVAQVMAESWGTLCPPYNHAGCGMARTRFPLAARARSAVLCDPREAEPMGTPYRSVAANPERFERMSAAEKRRVADDQAEWFLEHTWTKERFAKALTDTMERRVK